MVQTNQWKFLGTENAADRALQAWLAEKGIKAEDKSNLWGAIGQGVGLLGSKWLAG